jgi:hypothetical protein
MKQIAKLIVPTAIALVYATVLFGDTLRLSRKLEQLGVDRALIFTHGGYIDDHPLWSTDGSKLAANFAGRWIEAEVASILFEEATGHGQVIGLATDGRVDEVTSETTLNLYRAATIYDPRRIEVKGEFIVELKSVGFGIEFAVQRHGESREVRWKTDLENCHSLALSPDRTMVAYICEMNGLFVSRI